MRYFSEAEKRFVEKHKHLPKKEIHALFVEHFKRELSLPSLKDLQRRHGWLTGVQAGGVFTPGELAFLKRNQMSITRRELHAKFIAKFKREDISVSQIFSVCNNRGWRRRHQKHPHKPVGSKRLLNGYIYVKVGKPRDARQDRWWVQEHWVLWEEAHGRIPEGHTLKCRDGNVQNTDPSNWDCVLKGVSTRLRLRGYDDAPSVLKPTILAVSQLEHEINHARAGRRTN